MIDIAMEESTHLAKNLETRLLHRVVAYVYLASGTVAGTGYCLVLSIV